VAQAPREGDGIDGIEDAVEELRSTGRASEAEMKAMVIGGAETRKDRAAPREALCQSGVTEERGEFEALAVDVEMALSRQILDEKMASVGGKGTRLFPGSDGPGLGLEAAVEKLVESAEGGRILGEFLRRDAEPLDERGDLARRPGRVGPATV